MESLVIDIAPKPLGKVFALVGEGVQIMEDWHNVGLDPSHTSNQQHKKRENETRWTLDETELATSTWNRLTLDTNAAILSRKPVCLWPVAEEILLAPSARHCRIPLVDNLLLS